MTGEDEISFDDAVDYVANPADLGGGWAERAEGELERRVRAADVVAVVTVVSVRGSTDARGLRRQQIDARIDETLRGSAGESLQLGVSERAAGFDTVAGRSRQLLERQFVAYVKWAEGADGSVVARWHLSPATEALLGDVRRRLRARP